MKVWVVTMNEFDYDFVNPTFTKGVFMTETGAREYAKELRLDEKDVIEVEEHEVQE
jgi:hypothetical protein